MSFINLYSQQTIHSASNDLTGSSGAVSYSVGQTFFLTKAGVGGYVSEGIQQPYEILFMTGIDEQPGITLDIIIYPNPASTCVKLKTKISERQNLCCELYSTDGLLLSKMDIRSEETTVPMDNLAPATYILRVTENNRSLKTFRIIKN